MNFAFLRRFIMPRKLMPPNNRELRLRLRSSSMHPTAPEEMRSGEKVLDQA